MNSIAELEKVNPLPIMRLTGDFTGISKDTKVTLDVELEDIYGKKVFEGKKCKLSWQGSSTLNFPKKNYSLSLLEADGTTKYYFKPFADVPENDGYHMKADYIDVTHIRNIGYANFIKSNYNKSLPNNARGCMDGFPILIYENGVKKGIYQFATKQHSTVYGLDKSNPNHLMFRSGWCEHDYARETSAGSFDTLATDTTETAVPTQWEERFPETYSAENMAKLNRLIQWHIDCKNNIEKYRNEISDYWDLGYLIDYYIYLIALGMTDSGSNNMNIVTYDGNIWYPTFYDMDSTGGLSSGGYNKLNSTVSFPSEYCISRNTLFWELLSQGFAYEIAERYEQLRSSGLSNTNIVSYFTNYASKIPQEEITADIAMYQGIMVKDADINFMNTWHVSRLNHADTLQVFKKVDITSINLSSVSLTVGSSKKITATITPSTATDKRLVWSTSNESIATIDSNGNIVGITEGTVTITATSVRNEIYGSATITVSNEEQQAEVVTEGLVCWLDGRDGSATDTTWVDRSGNDNNLRILNSVGHNNFSDNCFYIDGYAGNNYGTFDKNMMALLTESSNDWTIEFYIKERVLFEGDTYYIMQHEPGAQDRFAIMSRNTKGHVLEFFKAPTLHTTSLSIGENTSDFIRIILIRKGDDFIFYADDSKQTITDSSFDNNYCLKDMTIGHQSDSYGLTCKFGSVKMYNRALTEAEIQQNYEYEQSIARG